MKRVLARLHPETVALGISVLWLLLVQILAVSAWHAELLTRQGALVHWLVVGVLPPALALWSMERGTPPAA